MSGADVLAVWDSMSSRAFDHDKDLVTSRLMKNKKAGELSQQRRDARAVLVELIQTSAAIQYAWIEGTSITDEEIHAHYEATVRCGGPSWEDQGEAYRASLSQPATQQGNVDG
jgi:hypothetical protein